MAIYFVAFKVFKCLCQILDGISPSALIFADISSLSIAYQLLDTPFILDTGSFVIAWKSLCVNIACEILGVGTSWLLEQQTWG